ncbi:hypothetical protein FS837_002975 [Tulasnella sp. UAMH 9824]|nr:hypothetical protein FS837_002975 [Tulasnella sp. UAMH 9824]
MPAGTSSKRKMVVQSDEEDVSSPQAGVSTSKRPRHSPSVEEPQVAPSIDKGKGKEKAQPPQHSSSRPRIPSSSKPSADSRARRCRNALRTEVTVTPTTGSTSGDSPADSVPTLVSSDHENDSLPGPSTRGVAEDPPPPPPAIPIASGDHGELERLRKELAAKDALIQKHQDAFSALQTSLQCQICLEIMWDPYITSCGHTSCLSCLQAWFRAPPADHAPNDAPPLAPHLRRKTCPTCRAPIRTRPTPVFIAKSVIGVAKPFFEPSALASENETRPVPIGLGANGGHPPDAWVGIFPPLHRAGEGGRHRHHDEDVDGVIEDAEDGVLRCVDCLYEIFDGVCAGCGRVFNDLQNDGGLTDEDEEDEEGHPFPFYDLGIGGLFQPWHPEADPWHDEDEEIESDDESDDDNEMHDFIVSDEQDGESEGENLSEDEGDAGDGAPGDQNRWNENHHNWNPNEVPTDLESHADSDSDGWPEQGEQREYLSLRRGAARAIRALEREGAPVDSEDERRLRSEHARERERFMFGNGEYPERDQPRVAGPSRIRSRLVIQSDDEEDENDDHPADDQASIAEEVAGEDDAGPEGERGWIGDQELYQGPSDDDEDDEEDSDQRYSEDEGGEDYDEDEGFYGDGGDWRRNHYFEDDGWGY